MTRRKRWLIAAAVIGVFTTLLLVLAARMPFTSETLRSRLVKTLSDRLDSEVELGALTLRILPAFHAEGRDLVIRHRGRRDVPPLISIGTFTIDASIRSLWNRRVKLVTLDGLVIQIPPRTRDEAADVADEVEAESPPPAPSSSWARGTTVVVDELHADEAQLIILRREPEKPRRVWQLHRLRMQTVGTGTSMPFDATLTNAVPPGRIETQGSFGPWQRQDPGLTPLNGLFTFRDADLGVFRGISGTLSSQGSFVGSLDTITVTGETETPDFMVRVAGNPVPLSTKYHAVVDGTNGNTRLERIEARFLDTPLLATGGVYEIEGRRGREVRLEVAIDKGRLEDVLKLAVKSSSAPMMGMLDLKTAFLLPPGDIDVIEKLQLDGEFSIEGGYFTNAQVQQTINELSVRASGKLQDAQKRQAAAAKTSTGSAPALGAMSPRVGSDFHGKFKLGKGILALQSIAFDIPGAAVRLNGQYDIPGERLNFKGDLLMDAKLSQTVGGWKSWLLKVVDPLFRKEGQTVVPLTISGPRSKPSFGVDMGRVF